MLSLTKVEVVESKNIKIYHSQVMKLLISLQIEFNQIVKSSRLVSLDRRLVSLVGKAPVCCVGGSGSIPGRTNTQGLKIIEEKVLPLL